MLFRLAFYSVLKNTYRKTEESYRSACQSLSTCYDREGDSINTIQVWAYGKVRKETMMLRHGLRTVARTCNPGPAFGVTWQRREWAFIAKTPLQSRVMLETHLVVMCTTSQWKLRSPFRNLRVRKVMYIVT